jgi:hypothetical protein
MTNDFDEREAAKRALESRRKADLEIIKAACTRLSEHFSTVQIFCTKDPVEHGASAGDTDSFRYGRGNWFARLGQVMDFIDEQRAKANDEPGENLI